MCRNDARDGVHTQDRLRADSIERVTPGYDRRMARMPHAGIVGNHQIDRKNLCVALEFWVFWEDLHQPHWPSPI